MSGDRQDFLERREARQRRVQQRSGQNLVAGRTPQPAGQLKARPPAPSEQKSGSASQTEVGKTPKNKEAAKRQAPRDASEAVEERLPARGLVGRRAAARRRAELAGLAALPPQPKPPLLSRVIMWGTVAICGLLILATLGEVWTVYRLNQQIDANQQTAAELQAQNQQLSNTNQQLQQPSTIEQEARKLGYIFPGDQPVVVVTTTPAATPSSHTAPPASNWWGFWPDWLKLFFGG
ncbi:MAG TPA: septum formation initiator family protein [Ktedonobacterales bacterium]|nr:septum formation initiator family protein [Ktedonobacterales bacterium]